ncbi:MAG: CYTH domain-containing protein [Rickettsiales bacterium]|nr:CYTH domain-containing protein [Rickettsiales bacterium]
MKKEIELKFCPVNKDEIRKKLSVAGFKMITPEFLMHRITFANPNLTDRWGRVRQEANKITMAIKRVVDKNTIDGTEEIEVVVPSVDIGVSFMAAVGFFPKSNQENYREIWQKNDVEATLDTWPGLPTMIEIESLNTDNDITENIYATIDALGFDKKNAQFGSIDLVYENVLNIPWKYICELPEITFANPPKKI